MKSILVIDDEVGTRESLKMVFQDHYQATLAEGPRQGLEALKKKFYPLIILDIFMEEMDGLELLKIIRQKYPQSEVVMLTAAKSLRTAADALKLGAADYIVKPFQVEEIMMVADRILKVRELSGEVELLRAESRREYDEELVVSKNPTMQKILKQVEQIASARTPVLITGESGTGKELLARLVHFRSDRAQRPFLAVNCASLPETLLESELFGHEKGAFTGAHQQRLGMFELADSGTIFLDEIGEMSLATQAKILRFLEENEFFRVGGSQVIKVDVRLITATNKNPKESIEKRTFREDLYYRINVINFHLPSLRERPEDIPLLIDHFFKRYKQELSAATEKIDDQGLELLRQYHWPGNIREIKNVIERTLALYGREPVISPKHLPKDLSPLSGYQTAAENVPLGEVSFEKAVADFEKVLIQRALQRSRGVQSQAAQLLKTTRRVLRYRMNKLGISASTEII